MREHWNCLAVLTDSYSNNTQEHEAREESLLDGELSAVIFQVGCYMIRSAQRVNM